MSPSLLLGFTIATCYGCAFHVVAGRRLWQWPLYWAAALVGFFGGYGVGVASGFELLRVGSIPLAAATLGTALALAIAWYFSA
jgi:hypothetical protein